MAIKSVKKTVITSLLSAALLVTCSAAAYAETFTGTVPRLGGNLFTPTRSASGPTQSVKVTYSEGNHNLYGTIVDAAHNHLGEEEVFLTIGQYEDIDSGASSGQDIALMIESSLTQTQTTNVTFDVLW